MIARTANITRQFRQATPEQLAEGMRWYAEAAQLARDLDPDNPTRAAGVIAALSPQTSWTQNVRMATLAYHDRPALRGLSRSIAQADAILAGAHPLDVLGGDKTRAFFANIDGDDQAVTVDRHAYDVAVGHKTDDKTRQALARKGIYQDIASLYRRAARILSKELGSYVSPREVQAVTWVAWRQA